MAKLERKIAVPSAPSDVFETGNYKVTNITVKTSDVSKPPTELFIVTPVLKGTYPVLLFCHGFMLANTCYTSLLQHIASHGYIVVAPKFYGLLWCSNTEEIKLAAQVTDWLSTGLPQVLPDKVNMDNDNLALSGHSRGGKTAFALAIANSQKTDRKWPFKALIGVDPVAGANKWLRSQPKILQYHTQSLDISIPISVIGTGYVDQFPVIATNDVNHVEFFKESKPPACHLVATYYGHCDMLDDKLGVIATIIRSMCKCGKGPRDLMRRSVGGIVVAFLRCYLRGYEADLDAIIKDPSIAPIILDPVTFDRETGKTGRVDAGQLGACPIGFSVCVDPTV